jgi:hypothetical protein
MPVARSGWINRKQPPKLSAIAKYNPNRAGAIESVWQPLYDFQTYAMAGQTQLSFFQVPVGQSSKTLADTNMVNQGMLAAPQRFFVTGVMVCFIPLNVVSVASATVQRALSNLVDVNAVANSGFLNFSIGAKNYLTDAPTGKFPPNFTIGGLVAAGIAIMPTTAGLTAAAFPQTDANYARATGRYYEITPFLIPATQNFAVTLNWPTAVAITVAGRIGVILDGFLFRESQ